SAYVPRILDLALGGRFPAPQLWRPLERLLWRTETRTAAWRAAHARLGALLGALAPGTAGDLLGATAVQCDAAVRAEVVSDFTPRLAAIPGGKRALDHALASIDRCIARRAAAGDLPAALAATPMRAPSTTRP